ncbi:MAG TPA: hypothetical protein VHN13_19540 [Candidatus Tectomicrobia bacterium]|nr:hypothetical protein [Candidatus Tectomicrobia bacterium]
MALYVRRMRQAQRLAPWQRRSARPLPAVTEALRHLRTPRRAASLVLRPSERAAAQDHRQLAQLTTQSSDLAEAVALAQDFAGVVRQRQPTQLDPRLVRAAASTLPPFRRFAGGLRADYAAVTFVLPSCPSNVTVGGSLRGIFFTLGHGFSSVCLVNESRRAMAWALPPPPISFAPAPARNRHRPFRPCS